MLGFTGSRSLAAMQTGRRKQKELAEASSLHVLTPYERAYFSCRR
jgi:hypothetical protein